MADKIGIAILAAGKGTRMKVDSPKALSPILGETLIDRVLATVDDFTGKSRLQPHIGVVVGHHGELIKSYLKEHYSGANCYFPKQQQQLGTADALKSYFEQTPGAWEQEYTCILCADTPLLKAEDLLKLWSTLSEKPDLQGVAACFETTDPTGYGRIVCKGKGFKIVEHKDASEQEKLIRLVNSGVYILKTSHIKEHLFNIDSQNQSQEYYLTDLFQTDMSVEAICFTDEISFLGVNSHQQLEQAERHLRLKKIRELQNQGVRVLDANSSYVELNVEVGAGTTLFPNTFLCGATRVGRDVLIEPGCMLKSVVVEDGVQIYANSYLEQAHIHKEASIGPFARIRPGSDIGDQAKIGNFVEVKKSTLDKGVKVSHLSYVGDAKIGAEANIGCGFITCNYDGVHKHQTIIGEGSFVGSDCQAVAPVRIGERSFVAAGSTITHDIPAEGFAIARSKQVTKPQMAQRFIKSKK